MQKMSQKNPNYKCTCLVFAINSYRGAGFIKENHSELECCSNCKITTHMFLMGPFKADPFDEVQLSSYSNKTALAV